jgi:exosortase A
MASILGRRDAPAAEAAGRMIGTHAPLLAASLAVFGILAVYAETVASIVAIWNRSQTFAHGYVVVPIAVWLAWRNRRTIAATPVVPWYPALLVVAAAGALWLVMAVGDVLGVAQFALAFMVQAAIVAVVGLKMARVIAFPLAFLLFAVPAGEFLVPTMIDRTADFVVTALQLSGVPVYRENNFFIIPSGAWSVVEACAGLRYLIASVMIGVVYAAVSYRTVWRRIAFIGASIVVPLVANWLRAYMIVMIGHLSDNKLAVGVDHLIYGWLFFGIVMALLFWVGSFWSEPEASVPTPTYYEAGATTTHLAPFRFFAVALTAIVLASLWRPVHALFDDPSTVNPKLVALGAAGGFVPADTPLPSWTPAYAGHSATLRQTFVRNGAASGLYIAYYRNQTDGRELVTSDNQLVLTSDFLWREVARENVVLPFDGKSTAAVRSVLTGAPGRVVAYRLYWIDGKLTVSDYRFKAWLAWSKLRGEGDDAALIVFYAPEHDNRDVAREALEALSPQVVRMLAATRETR